MTKPRKDREDRYIGGLMPGQYAEVEAAPVDQMPGGGPVASRPSSHGRDMLMRMWRRRREEDELLLLAMLDPN